MKHLTFLIIILIPIVLWIVSLSIDTGINSKVAWKLVNEWRVEKGYEPFIENDALCDVAKIRVKQIQVNFNHDIRYVKMIHDREPFDYMGENLAEGYNYERNMVWSWLASPSHRKNIANVFTHSCMVCEDNFCVQLFGGYLNPLTTR